MKKLLSLLCALMLLLGIVPASAGVYDLDHLFEQTLALRDLMLEKRTILPLLGGSDSVQDVADTVLDALSGSIREVRVLRFETAGTWERVRQLSGEELPEMSDTLRASYEKSLPSVLFNQINSSYGTVTVAATALLTTSGSAVVPGMTQDALAVLDFGTDWQLACVFIVGDDDIVHATAYPMNAQTGVLDGFYQLYGLTEADTVTYAGTEMYRVSANKALRDYTLEMKDVLAEAVQPQDLQGVPEILMAFAVKIGKGLTADTKIARVRMLPLSDAEADSFATHARLSRLTDRFHYMLGAEMQSAASLYTAPAVYDMPRGMENAAIVQADYTIRQDGMDYPVFSVVCIYTRQEDKVLCTAAYARWDEDMNFLDTILDAGLISADPAQIQELKP